MNTLTKEKIIELARQARLYHHPAFGNAIVELAEFIRLVLSEVAVQKPDADGWIAWVGGECPVPSATRVEVRMRYGPCHHARAGYFVWNHDGELDDIVAYRVIEGGAT